MGENDTNPEVLKAKLENLERQRVEDRASHKDDYEEMRRELRGLYARFWGILMGIMAIAGDRLVNFLVKGGKP
jgi:hypothetical protein